MRFVDPRETIVVCTKADFYDHPTDPCSRCGLKYWHHPDPPRIGRRTCERIKVRADGFERSGRERFIDVFCEDPACAVVSAPGLVDRVYCYGCVVALALRSLPQRVVKEVGYPTAFFPGLGRSRVLRPRR